MLFKAASQRKEGLKWQEKQNEQNFLVRRRDYKQRITDQPQERSQESEIIQSSSTAQSQPNKSIEKFLKKRRLAILRPKKLVTRRERIKRGY